MRFRFVIIILIFLVPFGFIELKLYNLQIKNGDYYFDKAEALSKLQQELVLKRGQILFTDRNKNNIPSSLNKDYQIIYAVPKEIENPKETAEILTPIIGWENKDLAKALDNQSSLFRLLAEKVSEEMASQVAGLKLQGVSLDKKQFRFYPFGTLASHLVGFVGINAEYDTPIGLYGIEKFYNKKLKENLNIQLTIDRDIQAQSETILDELVKKYDASRGTIIVAEPKTGKILALANTPNFDPNNYSQFPVANFLNPSLQNIYEPGSVFKPITMATGLDLGVISPETTFMDIGSVVVSGKKITNWDEKAHGKSTMTNIIEQSINTGAVFVGGKIGRKELLRYFKKFGFNEITGIDLPDEVIGSLKNLEKENAPEIDLATATFGQGIAVSPMQLIRAFMSFANGGLLLRPYVNTELNPLILRRIITEDTSKKVTAMMESAVEKAGVASLPQYRIAGKTGTAKIPDLENGGYTEEYIHSYVGFGPVSNPCFIALIKIEKPNANLAGITVVPAFKELARFILNYYNIAPDKIQDLENRK